MSGIASAISALNGRAIDSEDYRRGYQDGVFDTAIQLAAYANELVGEYDQMPCRFDLALLDKNAGAESNGKQESAG